MKLEACPFCTSGECTVDTTGWSAWENYPIAFKVKCKCGAQGPEHDSEHAAAAAWNTRPAVTR